MKNTILSGITAASLSVSGVSAEQNIHTFIQGGDGKTYASTFAQDASRAMSGEGNFENEVCGGILVSHLPQELQDTIMNVWGDVEQVRECTSESSPMDEL